MIWQATLAVLALAGAAGAETPLVSLVFGDQAIHAGPGDVLRAAVLPDGLATGQLHIRLSPRFNAPVATLSQAHVGQVLSILICGKVVAEPVLATALSRAEFVISVPDVPEAARLSKLLTSSGCNSAPGG